MAVIPSLFGPLLFIGSIGAGTGGGVLSMMSSGHWAMELGQRMSAYLLALLLKM